MARKRTTAALARTAEAATGERVATPVKSRQEATGEGVTGAREGGASKRNSLG